MKRLLAISWALPPIQAPRSIQVNRLLKGLTQRGWQISAVGAAPYDVQKHWRIDPSLSEDIPYEKIEAPSIEDWDVLRGLWFVFRSLMKLPDKQRVWIPSALKTTKKLLHDRTYGALVTFAVPWSDHLIGLQLHHEFNLPWIAHFSDPWTDSPYMSAPAWIRRKWQAWESKVIQDCSAVIFTNQQTLDQVMHKYPREWRKKAHVLPHSYEAVKNVSSAEHSRCRFVYTGSFYHEYRTPLMLFEALLKLSSDVVDHLEICLVGDTPRKYQQIAAQMGILDFIRFSPTVSYQESNRLSAGADVLLLVDAPSENSLFLPSKLVDYLAFEKPILGITPTRGASADLLRALGCPVHDPQDATSIAASISAFVEAWKQRRLGVEARFRQTADQYNMTTIAGRFEDIVCKVL